MYMYIYLHTHPPKHCFKQMYFNIIKSLSIFLSIYLSPFLALTIPPSLPPNNPLSLTPTNIPRMPNCISGNGSAEKPE